MSALDLAIPLIKRFEGFRAKAYKCPAGVTTIGYGTTGPDIRMGMTWTDAQATERLYADVKQFARGILALVPVTLTEGQVAALISFVYNVGLRAFSRSTLLKRILAGNMVAAGAEFLRWNKAGSRILEGLTTRRKAEKAMWETHS